MAKQPARSRRVARQATPAPSRGRRTQSPAQTPNTTRATPRSRQAARAASSSGHGRGGRIPPFVQPPPPPGSGPTGPGNGNNGIPRANDVLPGHLPAGTHLRDPARDTHVGARTIGHAYVTRTGPNEFSTVDGYEVRTPLLSTADVLAYQRTSRPLQQIRELVKNLYAKQPELMTRSSDITLLEVIYQYADNNLAAFMRNNRTEVIQLFATVSASMVQTASTQIRCHDGDIEVLHADYWWTWCLRTMPRRYILDCMGLPRNTPGRITVDVTLLTQAQLSRFIRCRAVAAWLRSAKTASALTERCNVIRRTGAAVVQQRLPLLDVAEFDVHGVYQQPFTLRRSANVERQVIP